MPAGTDPATLHIGEVAERLGLSLRTVAAERRVAEFTQQAVARCDELRDCLPRRRTPRS